MSSKEKRSKREKGEKEKTNIYTKVLLTRSVSLECKHINAKLTNTLLHILNSTVNGKCIDEGYVIKGSVKIIKRSSGIYDKYNNDGNFKYNIHYNVLICRPHKEDIISFEVSDINKAGIIGVKSVVDKYNINIKVIIPTEYFKINKLDIKTINIGDILFCQVVAIRFKYNDNSILVISKGV